MRDPDDFVNAAREWIGTRWIHQGRNRAGVDCVGLILVSLNDIGIQIPDMQGYRRSPDPDKFLGHIREHTDPALDTSPGMIGIFRDGTQPCHVGIFTRMYGQTSLIHAYASLGVVMEEPFIHDWPQKLVEIRAIKGLTWDS